MLLRTLARTALLLTTLPALAQTIPTRVLILGGGTSHDFAQQYEHIDTATLTAAGDAVRYTDALRDLNARLAQTDVLIQATNQPINETSIEHALMSFVAHGGGLVIVHAGIWYNWPNWSDYNRLLVGGGTRDHDAPAPFTVTVTAPKHPVMVGVPATFQITDELYHQQMAPEAASIDVLATAHSPLTGKDYPAIWIVHGQPGRIVCLTLGHDDRAHTNPAYQAILTNAVRWTAAMPHPSTPPR